MTKFLPNHFLIAVSFLSFYLYSEAPFSKSSQFPGN
jgi:hypothetical protein